MNIKLSPQDRIQLISYAVEQGYTEDKILFFSEIDELRAIAESKGETKERVSQYGDRTQGLHIQVDEIPRGNDVYFCIRDNHSITDYIGSIDRLEEEKIPLPEFLARNIKSKALPVFILYHEIAHHVLGHVNPPNPDSAERDADQWAADQINRKFEP